MLPRAAPLAHTIASTNLEREYVYVCALSRVPSTRMRTRSRVLIMYARIPEIDSPVTRTRLSSYP